MTIRTTLLLLGVGAAGLDAQVTGVPDSLYYLRLPDNPEEYTDSVEHGRQRAGEFLRVGCPSDHPWSGAVLTALENRAETSLRVRGKWADGIAGIGFHDCSTTDLQRMEDWVVRWATAGYESGTWATGDYDPDEATAGYYLVHALGSFRDSETAAALALKIACDQGIHTGIRRQANLSLPPDKMMDEMRSIEWTGGTRLPVMPGVDSRPEQCRDASP